MLEPVVSGTAVLDVSFATGYKCGRTTSWTTFVNSDSLSAQIYRRSTSFSTTLGGGTQTLRVHSAQVILEFDIDGTLSGQPFPTDIMTPYNWAVHLNSLSITHVFDPGVDFDLELATLPDTNEDGYLLPEDHDFNREGDLIQVLFETVPLGSVVYSHIDITAALREDLFGSTDEGLTLGFILRKGYFSP